MISQLNTHCARNETWLSVILEESSVTAVIFFSSNFFPYCCLNCPLALYFMGHSSRRRKAILKNYWSYISECFVHFYTAVCLIPKFHRVHIQKSDVKKGDHVCFSLAFGVGKLVIGILTSCQPHRFTSGICASDQQQMEWTVSKLVNIHEIRGTTDPVTAQGLKAIDCHVPTLPAALAELTRFCSVVTCHCFLGYLYSEFNFGQE